MPVFQCDACPVVIDIGGVKFDGVYTFALDAEGKPVSVED